MNIKALLLLLLVGCAEPATTTAIEEVSHPNLTWMVGTWDCKAQYSTVLQSRTFFHRLPASYVLTEDTDAEALLGDGTAVVRGRYEEGKANDQFPPVAYSDTWVMSPKTDANGNAPMMYDAVFDDLGALSLSGINIGLGSGSPFLGFDDLNDVGGLRTFPSDGMTDGTKNTVGMIGSESVIVNRDGSVGFTRNWDVKIGIGTFQLFYSLSCTRVDVSARVSATPNEIPCDPGIGCTGGGGGDGSTCQPTSCLQLSECNSLCFTCQLNSNRTAGVCH